MANDPVSLSPEDIAEMRFIADAAAASGFERIQVDPAHVVALIDALHAQEAARDKNANEHLDLICRLHSLADEYAGPVAIDSTPAQDLEAIEDGIAGAQSERDEYRRERDELRDDRDRLQKLINTPRIDDFFEAVRIEAAHQVARWGVEHDAGKRTEDWIALMTYLLGKAAKAYWAGDVSKLLHHVITGAAVFLNWHRNLTGESTLMRPGIGPNVSNDHEEVPMRAAANAAASTTGNG